MTTTTPLALKQTRKTEKTNPEDWRTQTPIETLKYENVLPWDYHLMSPMKDFHPETLIYYVFLVNKVGGNDMYLV